VLQVRGRTQGGLAMSHIRDRVQAAGGTVTDETNGDRTVIDVRFPATALDDSTASPVGASSS
jgi:signal transduction histidine kinase